MYKVLEKKVLCEGLYEMKIEAPDFAKKAQPGHFLIIKVSEEGERIPLTVADFDAEEGSVTIVFAPIGVSTEKIAQLEVGDYVDDFTGPLGEASVIENYGTVVMIGGGVGIAPIYPVARALKAAGNKVISIIGARNEKLLMWEDKMDEISDEFYIATDDGSKGQKGFVTDILGQVMEKEEINRVWAIGPVPMMRAVSNLTRDKVKTIVSMNPVMVDGTGMCGACRVSVGNETKFACVDGPEFDGHLIDFDLAARRLAYYKNEEKAALEHRHQHHHDHGGGCKCQKN